MYGLLLLLFSFLSINPPSAGTINYQIKPLPLADRTNIEVTVDFESPEKAPVSVTLPTDYFGTPNLYRFVKSFEGEAGTVIKPGESEDKRIAVPNKDGRIRIKYLLSYDPELFKFNTYSPNNSSTHFHLAGCQWALQIGELKEKHELKISFAGVPENWETYSNISSNPRKFEITASLEDLISTVIGGGEKKDVSRFTYRDTPYSIIVRGDFDIPRKEIVDAAEKIVKLQRDYFPGSKQDFYHIVILPRSENVAGVRFENSFITFLKQDVTRRQLYLLLAHEMSHNWLNGEIIKPEEGESSLKYAWFYEGFDEYFARTLLLSSGLITEREFIELINRDIINIADNPHGSANFDDVLEAVKERKYGQAFNKLSYYRGALMAFNWDAQIRRFDKNRSIGDLVKEVYKASSDKGGNFSGKDLFELAAKMGASAEKDFENYIIEGKPIRVSQDIFDNRYVLKETDVPAFDPGFSIRESYSNKKITGLREGSEAYKAGLRNGMEFVLAKNDGRFSNAWLPEKPLSVTVRIEGEEKVIDYFPHGETEKLMLLKPR
ncbi:MAG: hypothetical protein R2681_04315 [Pyrinomonadaceae bacterium]